MISSLQAYPADLTAWRDDLSFDNEPAYDLRRCADDFTFDLRKEARQAVSTRVLVADDSSTMRKIILRSLQAIGVSGAVQAADGDEALSRFKPGDFDLVLADWSMPGKSGLEVTDAIRRQDPNIPIIVVTTEAERARIPSPKLTGASDYLVKPFTSQALREKLDQYGC